MMKRHFLRLFTFNNWANQAIANCLLTNDITDEQTLLLASHLAHAERNWYFRAISQQNDVPIWTPAAPDAIASELADIAGRWIAHLQTLHDADFDSTLAYTNMAGDPFSDRLADVLTHVVNHSTYHRGQVAQRIRALGIAPPATDFIVFARQHP